MEEKPVSNVPRSYANAPTIPTGRKVSLDELIPGTGEVLLEIGSGRGAFTVEYASLHSSVRLLAFEVRRKFAAQLDERLKKLGLTHARCFADDAVSALVRLEPAGSITRVAIHFPDPWWKKRHEKRLVVRDELVPQLARLVRVGGMVFVQTDVADRLEQYREVVCQGGYFREDESQRTKDSPLAPARSNRERRAIADGLPVFRAAFIRTETT